jgi:hypothetical protein
MSRFVGSVLASFVVVSSLASAASAATIPIGFFTFDEDVVFTGNSFNITNLTGANALPPDFPLTDLLTFTVTGLTGEVDDGSIFNVSGSAFTADASGNLQCSEAGDASTGDCNFAAYDVVSATISGTLSPTGGLSGLPPGFIGIESTFTATLDGAACDSTFVTAGCFVVVEATLVREPGVPEPATLLLLQLGLGALAGSRLRKSDLLKRLRTGRG